MDRKIHRRMMDARYYLENGVAHPFTTGSRAQRSFRLPRLFFLLLLLPLLSSFPFMSTPVFISPRSVSAPVQREREREREGEAGFGDQDRPALENECRPRRRNHPPDARPLTCRRTRAREQKGRYSTNSVATLDQNEMTPRFRAEKKNSGEQPCGMRALEYVEKDGT